MRNKYMRIDTGIFYIRICECPYGYIFCACAVVHAEHGRAHRKKDAFLLTYETPLLCERAAVFYLREKYLYGAVNIKAMFYLRKNIGNFRQLEKLLLNFARDSIII